jgi:hypothetical protein
VALHFPMVRSAWRTLGDEARPVARTARLVEGRGVERTMKRLPTTSQYWGVWSHGPRSLTETEVGTNARDLQNTYPRIVPSLVESRPRRKECLAASNACFVLHNCS